MKKHTLIKCVISLLLCSLLIYVPAAGCCENDNKEKYEKTERLSAPLASGQTLELQNKVGDITVIGADVKECEVIAKITAKAKTEEIAKKLVEAVQIKLEPSDDKLNIKIEQPADKSNKSVNIDFNITVPRQTALQLTTNVGEIEITSITKPIKAKTNVGDISCKEITDKTNIDTDVGEVEVLYSKSATGACNANIETNIGEIDFTTPPNLSAKVNFSTNIGLIETGLPLEIKGMLGKKSNGTIGKGEGQITLKTNIGSIEIK
jgi:hypothetical protein